VGYIGGMGRGEGVRVRLCRPADRGSIERLGHPPSVAGMLCPPPARRIAWRLLGTRAVAVLAEEAGTGAVIGSAQFVRQHRSPGTWIFGHWRVAAGRRRQGIGRRILAEGMRRLPEVTRLYSHVEIDNDASIEAHKRLGFEVGRTLWGSAPLGVLSTIGPATPALRLEPAGARDWPVLFAIYARAMGSLWLRLFPSLGPRTFLGGTRGGLRAGAVAVARGGQGAGSDARAPGAKAISGDRSVAGYLVWESSAVTLFAEPDACDQALLARVALQVLAQGARRDLEIGLRGLPRSLAVRPGTIVLQELMGMPDVRTQWRG
jgi:L-amino acid N-acyltransferase YncA